jgi:glycerol-3-phosphate dehydrogenase
VPEQFDCLILAGSVKGCGTLRDLCLQEMHVLPLTGEDFFAGASGGSSRRRQVGPEYLETGQFQRVKLSLTERKMVRSTAPQEVQPLDLTLLVRSVFGGNLRFALRFLRGKTKLRESRSLISALGLKVRDVRARAWKAIPNHRMLQGGLRRMIPDLHPAITGAAIFDDGQLTHAERLRLELILDGAAMPKSRAFMPSHGRSPRRTIRDFCARWCRPYMPLSASTC